MKLPYNTKLPARVIGVLFKNTETTKVLKIDKIFLGSKHGNHVTINLFSEHDGRLAHLLPQDYPHMFGAMIEFDGPIYLNPGDSIKGFCVSDDPNVTVSIQGDPNYA